MNTTTMNLDRATANRLRPQAHKVLRRLEQTTSLTAREAMADYNMSSATLARRIVDLEEAGVPIQRIRKTHPIHGVKYTQYRLGA